MLPPAKLFMGLDMKNLHIIFIFKFRGINNGNGQTPEW